MDLRTDSNFVTLGAWTPTKQAFETYSKGVGYKTFLPDPAEEPVEQLRISTPWIPGDLHSKRLAYKSRSCCKPFFISETKETYLLINFCKISAIPVWISTWANTRDWEPKLCSKDQRMKLERCLKEPWENYVLLWATKIERFSVSVPRNQHNDKKLRELSSWPQREPQTMLSLPSFFLSKTWQRQSSALRCGSPVIKLAQSFCFGFEWSQCYLRLHLKSLMQNMQKIATQHGTRTRFLTNYHRP